MRPNDRVLAPSQFRGSCSTGQTTPLLEKIPKPVPQPSSIHRCASMLCFSSWKIHFIIPNLVYGLPCWKDAPSA